jgi:hypothetical protein
MGRAHATAHGSFAPEHSDAVPTVLGRGGRSLDRLGPGGSRAWQNVARDLRRTARPIEARLSSPS